MRKLDLIPAIGLALIFAAALFGGLSFDTGAVVFSPLCLILVGIIILSWSVLSGRTRHLLDPGGWIIVFALYLASDFCLRQYSFLQGATRRLELFSSLIVCVALPVRYWSKLIYFGAIAASAGAAIVFVVNCNAQLIFSDDHPTFFYRLWLLRQNFPNIPFYSPLWNAGIDARDFFPTGAHGVFILFAPLIYLWPLQQIYNVIVASEVFVLAPVLVGLAAWVHSRSILNSALAALIAAAPNLFWYRWGLAYGTMGFINAISFAPLALSLISSALKEGTLQNRWCAVLFLAVSFCVCWPLATIVLLPALICCLFRARLLLRNNNLRLCLAGLLLLHIPWIALFIRCSAVTKFIAGNTVASIEQRADPRVLAAERRDFAPLKTLRTAFAPINPVIGFCLVPAMMLAWRRRLRLEVASCLWLLFLGVIVSNWFPQLELERMVLVGALLAAPLISSWLLEWGDGRRRLLAAVPLTVCALIPFTTWRAANNVTPERYFLQAPYVTELAKSANEGANGGRVLVAGFTLHELSHGHLAPLPLLSSVPFIANSFVHDKWERGDVIPAYFRARGDLGVEEYLKLLNVSLILAHDQRWQRWFEDRPTKFRLLGQFGKFKLFRNQTFVNNYFALGRGELVDQTDNALRVRVDSSGAVLKFRYFQFLHSSACALRPFEAAPGYSLIELVDCAPGQEVTIASGSPWRRLW